MYKHVALLLMLGVAGAAAQVQTNRPLLEAVAANPGLSSLAEAINTDPALVEVLTDFSGTIFAPNNQAFDDATAAADALGFTIDQDLLSKILAYHAVPGEPTFSADLSDGMTLPTADDGEELTVAFEDGELTIQGVGSSAQIVTPDIAVGDNVAVHIIDTVLLPIALPTAPEETDAPAPAPEEEEEEMAEGPATDMIPVDTRRTYDSVVDAAAGEGLTLLTAALTAADLAGALGPEFNGTVFAPANEAIAAAVASLGLNLESLNEEQLTGLSDILQYHVVPDVVAFSTDLPNGNTAVDTLVGVPLTIMKRANGVFLTDASGQRCMVTAADVAAGDAVVHVIDCVLMPMAAAMSPAPGMAPPTASATTAFASVAAMAASLLAAALLM